MRKSNKAKIKSMRNNHFLHQLEKLIMDQQKITKKLKVHRINNCKKVEKRNDKNRNFGFLINKLKKNDYIYIFYLKKKKNIHISI